MTDNNYRSELSASNPVAETDSQRVTDGSPSASATAAAVDRVDPLADDSSEPVATDFPGTDTTDDLWLVALCGLPGVGKSTVASYVMEHTDATRLRTDVIRKELFDEPEYTKAERDTVYGALHDRAEEHLDAGESVVLDATFAQAQYRRPLQHIADEHEAQFQFVRVVCDQSVVEDRIAEREGVSDADFEVYQHFKRTFEPLTADHVTVDNSTSKADTRAQVDRLFEKH